MTKRELRDIYYSRLRRLVRRDVNAESPEWGSDTRFAGRMVNAYTEPGSGQVHLIEWRRRA